MWGKFLKNKSISFDPISKDEYKSLLNQIPFKENYINAKRLNLAKNMHIIFLDELLKLTHYMRENLNIQMSVLEEILKKYLNLKMIQG